MSATYERQHRKMKNRKVLLLNASEEIIDTISWQRAICLLFSDRVMKPYNFNEHYKITTGNGVYELPTAVMLKEYALIPYKPAKISRRNIFLRDNLVCQYTGEKLLYKDASIDHVIPTSRGGKNTWYNMVTCHKKVNRKKGARTPEEAGLKLIRKPAQVTRSELVYNSLNNKQLDMWKRWL